MKEKKKAYRKKRNINYDAVPEWIVVAMEMNLKRAGRINEGVRERKASRQAQKTTTRTRLGTFDTI